jgi:hypothetical protein
MNAVTVDCGGDPAVSYRFAPVESRPVVGPDLASVLFSTVGRICQNVAARILVP